MFKLKDTLRTIKATKLHMIMVLLALVWCDMSITYAALEKINAIEKGYVNVQELSLAASPAIDSLGLKRGIILGGMINSLIVITISLILPTEYLFGVFSGIFIMACYMNIRLILTVIGLFG